MCVGEAVVRLESELKARPHGPGAGSWHLSWIIIERPLCAHSFIHSFNKNVLPANPLPGTALVLGTLRSPCAGPWGGVPWQVSTAQPGQVWPLLLTRGAGIAVNTGREAQENGPGWGRGGWGGTLDLRQALATLGRRGQEWRRLPQSPCSESPSSCRLCERSLSCSWGSR